MRWSIDAVNSENVPKLTKLIGLAGHTLGRILRRISCNRGNASYDLIEMSRSSPAGRPRQILLKKC